MFSTDSVSSQSDLSVGVHTESGVLKGCDLGQFQAGDAQQRLISCVSNDQSGEVCMHVLLPPLHFFFLLWESEQV